MHDGQAQPGILAFRLGGEIRLENLGQNLRVDAGAVILNRQRDQRRLIVESFAIDE